MNWIELVYNLPDDYSEYLTRESSDDCECTRPNIYWNPWNRAAGEPRPTTGFCDICKRYRHARSLDAVSS